MTNTEKNKMMMYQGVDSIFSKNQETIAAVPPLMEKVEQFRAVVNKILERDRVYLNVSAGATAAKNSALDTLVDETIIIGNVLYSLGRTIEDEELKASCRLTISDFNRLRENEREQVCVRIHTLAQEHAEQLVPYGITTEALAVYSGIHENYRKQAGIQQTKRAECKAARELLFDAFREADDILREDIDRLIELLRKTNNELCIEYKAARVIRDLGGSHTAKQNGVQESIVVPEEVPTAETAV